MLNTPMHFNNGLIRNATRDDSAEIAKNLLPEDRIELRIDLCTLGEQWLNDEQVINVVIGAQNTHYVVEDKDGNIPIIFGTTMFQGTTKTAAITFLCTKHIHTYSYEVLKNIRKVMHAMMGTNIHVLVNKTLVRNKLHQKLLKFLGANLLDKEVIKGHEFQYFTITKPQ